MLACPWDYQNLTADGTELVCPRGHRFAVEADVPILTDHARREAVPGNMEPCRFSPGENTVDPFVNDWVVNTNGNLYWGARGKLRRYPVPTWPIPVGEGKLVVDIGCSWGRWSIAAARAGFRPIGVDVHLDALLAAARVSRQLGACASYVCGTADRLPLKSASVDAVFSYSVLQHLERTKVFDVFREMARVLRPGGRLLTQLPNRFGPFALLRQAKRGFRDGRPGTFEMRYWSRAQIRAAVEHAGLRLVSIRADGFLTQNPQLADLDLLSAWGKCVVLASHAGCSASAVFPVFARFADSLWIEARAPRACTDSA